MRGERIPVVLAIDVEPDDPEFRPGTMEPWLGFEACVELADELRDLLSRASHRDVRLTWFLRLDPQITHGYGSPTWPFEAYAPLIDRLRAAGDAIGVHPHAWRWDDGPARWIADVKDDTWVEHCLRVSLDAYRTALDEPCRVHRAGDRYMSNGLAQLLLAEGILVDMTPEPGMRGVPTNSARPHTAALPDMASVPRRPYFPDRDDWRAAGHETELLMIPLASADPGPMLGSLRSTGRKVRNIGRPLHRPLLPWAPGLGVQIWDLLARDIDSGALSVLSFAWRSHLGIDRQSRAALCDSFEALARHELISSLEFVTALEARSSVLANPSAIARPV